MKFIYNNNYLNSNWQWSCFTRDRAICFAKRSINEQKRYCKFFFFSSLLMLIISTD